MMKKKTEKNKTSFSAGLKARTSAFFSKIKNELSRFAEEVRSIPARIKAYPDKLREMSAPQRSLEVLKLIRAVLTVIALIFVPIAAYAMQESFYYSTSDLTAGMFEYNVLFVYLFEVLILSLTWSPRWAVFGAAALCGIVGVAEYAVMLFRFVPIQPWDILSLGTALSVADNYKFVWSGKVITLVSAFALLLILALFCVAKPKKPNIGKLPVRIFCTLLCIFMMSGYVSLSGNEDFQEDMGYYPYLFTPTVVYRRNGFYFSFTSLLKYMDIDEPKGYDAEELRETAEDIAASEAETEGCVKVNEKVDRPNIIVIMNESLSDLDVYGDIDTGDTEILPFISSLKENTVKGYAYASVKGGNTPNSEFEFLTGDTMAFLPAGSIPYQQYLTDETPNFFTQLSALGYKTYGIHPYNASGWRRDTVYPLLGISESFFSKDFKYPKRIRSYVSDESVYDMIYELVRLNQGNGDPTAVFAVTMQNHGGYSDGDEYDNFVPNVELYNMADNRYGSVSTYLSLLRLSDRAFEGLVDIFERYSEPTVILMFGDHQPNTTVTDPVLDAFGMESETEDLCELSLQYKVPFVLWANYDIEEQEGISTSLNYLNVYLSEAAGLQLSEYQLVRRSLMSEYPVITANFMMDAQGNTVSVDSASGGLLDVYRKMQYAHLFDKKDPLEGFFD